MKKEVVQTDITVVGGGLAGVCASVAAARLGYQVSLIQNRPVLGGNSSSEIRVWIVGATRHGLNRFARETGIMGEMFVENQYRNPDGNPYYWDLIVLETVKNEENIQLFLNTDVHEVEAEGSDQQKKIKSVTGWMMGSERYVRFKSNVFLDCTGDGLVGYLAGARYKIGREARAEYNESLAPEKSDDDLLGSTIFFYTKDAGHPVKFVPPNFAKDISKTPIPENRVIRAGTSGCHYWWIEWGGELDIIYDNERIRDELWSVIYGIWDYVKNSGKFDAENMTLEWVGALPGKRESRHFIGDYTISQNDIMDQKPFVDAVAFGGWSIDLHPPEGMYAKTSGSNHLQPDGLYHIPFRSLYSVNTSNLLFAGRDISVTHVAFASTRVMATCAAIGEAAGVGAAMCIQKNKSPKGIYEHHMEEMQQVLLRQDASILGVKNQDEKDHARGAQVEASSYLQSLSVTQADERYCMGSDIGILVPVDSKMSQLELLVDTEEQTNIEIELWDTDKPQNYFPHTLQDRSVVQVSKCKKKWIKFDLNWKPLNPQDAFIVVKKNNSLALYLSHEPMSGVLSFVHKEKVDSKLSREVEIKPIVEWVMDPVVRKPFCFRILSETSVYSPNKVINGYARPYAGPNMWVSDPMKNEKEEWIELSWKSHIAIEEIQITFNDDVNEDLINLHHHRTPFDIIPELVKDYNIKALINDRWELVNETINNRKRKRCHVLDEKIETNRLRISIKETNGCPRAEVVEVRAYSEALSNSNKLK